jgi:hypothetical protein
VPTTAITRQDLLVGVGSVVNMVAHASRMRTVGVKPLNVNLIAILTVVLQLTSSDRRRGGGPDWGRGWSDPRMAAEHKHIMIWSWRCGSLLRIDEQRWRGMNSRWWWRRRSWPCRGCPCTATTGGARGPAITTTGARRRMIRYMNNDGGGWTTAVVAVAGFLAWQPAVQQMAHFF